MDDFGAPMIFLPETRMVRIFLKQ